MSWWWALAFSVGGVFAGLALGIVILEVVNRYNIDE